MLSDSARISTTGDYRQVLLVLSLFGLRSLSVIFNPFHVLPSAIAVSEVLLAHGKATLLLFCWLSFKFLWDSTQSRPG